MVASAPSAARAAVCKYLPPPAKVSKAERLLRDTIQARKDYGFPHGREFVRRVLANPANRRPIFEGMFAMTRRERAIEVIETADTVYLGAVVETGYVEDLDARSYSLTATLAQPLGDRAVRTIEYGYEVKPGAPPRG